MISESSTETNRIDFSLLKSVGLKIMTAYLIQAATTFSYISFLSFMGERVAADLRILLFQRLLVQDIGFFDEQRTGELNACLGADVQEFKSCLKIVISQGLRTLTQVGGSMVSMYLTSSKMALLTLALLSGFVLCGSIFGAFLRQISYAAQRQGGVASAVAEEAFDNIRTVRAFAMEDEELRLFTNETTKARKLNEFLGIGIGVFQGATNLFLNGAVLAVLYGGAHLISSSELDPGGLMSFLASAQMIQRSLGQLSIVFGHAIKGWSAAARVFEFIEYPGPENLTHGTTFPLSSLTGAIRFENVTFAYPTRPNQNALENLTLEVAPGKVLGICGPSGQGKSTFASLLVRFYEPSKGRILLDGIELKALNPSWLRRCVIGFISQDPVLFATTIKENIRYGKPEASDLEIIEAAKLANAHEFISDFRDGYDTLVGERGVTLSGGQKQRIAIARALLKNAPILILDEATSSLDYESERLVQEALQNVMRDRTVILIAHRLSTIRNADYIAVMKYGQVAEVSKS
ncbi:unnamed protein product [Enterobius vermicularis]|uniref:Mitochondrial potassium channel ATP-binding subunit n=1 Tax=Enterobius vermicularis TaxID=51028 RepID=A0A0N4VIU9_ENTVE|nr:unnamed protein product [Enterobius vermicularis]